jgi:hypothetical protein
MENLSHIAEVKALHTLALRPGCLEQMSGRALIPFCCHLREFVADDEIAVILLPHSIQL